MARTTSYLPGAIVACLMLAACDPSSAATARAYRIKTLDQAIGGPVADARVGDVLMENDKIRLVIEGGRKSRQFLDQGGTLIDADVVRDYAGQRGGNGLDQLGQIAPVGNLYIAKAVEEDQVRITDSDQGAEVTAAADAVPLQNILTVLGVLVQRDYIDPSYDHGKFRIYNEYELRPGERVLRITTTIGHDIPFCAPEPADGCNASCDDIWYDDDCECPEVPVRCYEGVLSTETGIVDAVPLPDGENRGLLDILMGDLPRPLGAGRCDTDGDCAADEDCTGITTPLGGTSRVCRPNKGHDAGVAMGDMLLFGGNLSIFVPGPGKDSDSDFHRLFGSGVDTLGSPLPFDAVYALGKGVSYGYSAPQGKVLVPIFGGSFSFGATAAASCTHGDKGCLAGKLIRSERWVSVGFGDAASALEPLERARGSAVGTLKGVVMRAGSGSPVDDGEVYALKDPRDLECDGACEKRCGDAPSGDALKTMSLDEVMAANKCRSVDATFLEGTAGAVTMAKVDAGVRPTVTGRYQMTVPTGRYVLVATDSLSSVSKVVPVTVEANKTREVAFVLPRLGKLAYSLFDGHAKPVAGRVIVGQCLPENPCVDDDECREGTTCQQGSCACERSRFKPLELGGARFADGVVAFDQTANGTGVLDLPPGKYDVVFSHGPQHTVDRKRVTIEASTTTSLRGDVFRAVDRSGWSSSDFHVHADPSLDSDTPLTERVTSYLAEDMDFMSSSDHDVLTDYEPLLEQMKVRDRLSTQVGVEVSTQEIGHFIGWPLRYQQWDDGKRVDGNGAFDWRGLVPQEIMDSLRKLRDDRPVVVEVPHPYSYFDYYSLDPVSLEPTDTLLSTINPLLSAVSFSGDFDAMEILNGKNADYFRRPTVGELRFFSQGLDALNKEREAGELDEEEYERRRFLLSVEGVRRILHRTPEEQQAAIAGTGNDYDCLCGADGDCAAGSHCNLETLTCVRGDLTDPDPSKVPGDAALCRRFRGVVDDWFNMLNRGMRRTVLSGSDTHDIYGGEAGIPRTMVRNHGTTGAYLDSDVVAKAILGGEAIVTNGPMIHFTVDGAGVGSSVTAAKDGKVKLDVRVETAPWYDVDRVEVYRNGELIHWISGCRLGERDEGESDPHKHACIKPSSENPVAYREVLEDEPGRDAWYVVIAMGIDGRNLAPVYSSGTLARVGTFEVAQKIFDLIPALSTFRTPRSPVIYPTFPIAITNPVWVDVDGKGWEPLAPPPSWCRKKNDVGCDR